MPCLSRADRCQVQGSLLPRLLLQVGVRVGQRCGDAGDKQVWVMDEMCGDGGDIVVWVVMDEICRHAGDKRGVGDG